MDKMDYKKAFKDLYFPKTTPVVIDVPQMTFIQVQGKGNPNEENGEYQKAVELLYALSYSIKMSPKSGEKIENYFEYVVPPLEGLWWIENGCEFNYSNKSEFNWVSMIRQPEFVTDEVFQLATASVNKKKPHIDTTKANLVSYSEGICVQCMHIGSFDDEPTTIEKIKQYIRDNNYIQDISDERRHHEIYLSDPRKVDISKMKTVLRYPVRRK